MLCSEFALVRQREPAAAYKPLPCNRWTCPYCAPMLRARLVKRIQAGKPNRMLTLTVSPSIGSGPRHRRQLLHDAWRILTKRICRKLKIKTLPYMAFVEKTQRGEPHLHIMLRCGYIAQRWISHQMRELLHAPVVDIRVVKDEKHAAFYVSKYVTKAPASFAGFRRFWASASYRQTPADKPPNTDDTPEWHGVVRLRWREFIQERLVSGYSWATTDDGWYLFEQPGTRCSPGRSGGAGKPWRVNTVASRAWQAQ